jgi:peptide/nickel transport system permease protein
MLAFMLGRLMQGLGVMLTVALLAFLIFRYIGDPVDSLVVEDATREERAELREKLGLDDSMAIQFARFIGNAVQGNFGLSYRNRRPVKNLIAERLPATLELVFFAAVVSFALGIPLGVYTALNRNGFISHALQVISLIGISLPTFVTGILLILVFSVNLHWLPSFGRGDVIDIGWWSTGVLTASGLKSLVLPSLMLGLFQVTLIMRLVRAEMLEVLRTDYIKFARARGLSNRTVHFGHALRNTMVPVMTIAGLQIGGLIAFAIITETVFQWPGMGFLFIQAVSFIDVPVMAAYLVLVAFIFVVINIAVDIAYFFVDPRLRIDRTQAGHHTP